MDDWRDLLVCPVCGEPLYLDAGSLRDASGHSYDIARQGYVNLLTHVPPTAGDEPAMLEARSAFLARGHFAPLRSAVADAVAEAATVPGCIADAGAGTGEYLADALERLPDRVGLALDVSKAAARRSARAHPRLRAIVCDVWERLPVADGSVAVVMDVFAPRNAAEFARVLHPEGALVVATPTVRHLAELTALPGMVHVDPEKQERLASALGAFFELERNELVERELALSIDDARAAIAMGPSARHVQIAEVERSLARLGEPSSVTLSVTVGTWRRAGSSATEAEARHEQANGRSSSDERQL